MRIETLAEPTGLFNDININEERGDESISPHEFYQGNENEFEKTKRLAMKVISIIGPGGTFSLEDKEDICQQVFEKVLNARASFDEERSFSAWVSTIAKNTTIDEIRKRARRPYIVYEMYTQENEGYEDVIYEQGSSAPSPEEYVIANETAELVCSILSSLPASQREVIEQVFFYGLSDKEIAERENLPLGTVKTRKRRGLRRLRTLLEERNKGEIDI